MKHTVHILMMVVLVFCVTPALAQTQHYTCPMHTHYFSDHAGKCPICGMDLIAVESGEEQAQMSSAHQAAGEKEILYWRAPMDPNYRSDKPGKSPMGMDLVPVYAQDTSMTTEGRAVVQISSEMIQNTGVRFERAQMNDFGSVVRGYGDVTENTRLQFDISSRVEGWIENLKIKAVGDDVKKGDLLFNFYSPALISAQKDLVSALATGLSGRIDSAAKRLISLGMQKQAIDAVKKQRKPFDSVPFYAEANGVVSRIDIRDGTYAKPGMNLMVLQNYDTVWIEVDIAEQDIAFMTQKTKASVSMPAFGVKDQVAKVDYIYPTMNRATRTGRIRLVLDNPDGKFKPGAYADVTLETNVKKRLSIPSDAILKSKDGDYVVLAKGQGRFQPVEVVIGLSYKGRAEVVSGLSEEDDVVISGQFLIDSESALRESFRKMKSPSAAMDKDQMIGESHDQH